MTETRIPFSTIVKNQLPFYVRSEFPLIGEFLSQYYQSQEFQGAPVDLVQNIDRYIKLNNNTNQITSTTLRSDIDELDTTINVLNTQGFPEKYGLIRINDEIITYSGKTTNSFTGCIRGFQGYVSDSQGDFVFSATETATHSSEDTVENLSIEFLSKFLTKIKYQILPGLESRDLDSQIDQNLFIKHSKDFYNSKGTDQSFKILFKALYGEDVEIIKPKDNLFTPSSSLYKITKDMVVEPISGNVQDIEGYTLFQNSYSNIINKSYAPITDVERIVVSGASTDYYKVSFDANYSRDLQFSGAEYGTFVSHPRTKIVGDYTTSSSTLDVDSTVGFPNSGQLYLTYSDRSAGIVSYTSKSINQFYGVSGITQNILNDTVVGVNTFATTTLADCSQVSVRILSVLTNLSIGSSIITPGYAY